ncbi:uncharacterized protein LOC6568240 [Drosophila grimshawi]|uniref:GH13879 n=1 Tax=Drosophila grimshawi TaxID=7222 RepID=B4JTP7_DROGR|nr:uncharacterized protein LOC6568240 [Drosophila grimshawi]EDV91476.1 GH13879 [Drosophila grimshawi]
MSSSVFNETPSIRPNGADGDSNLVVVYTKNGISFDERAIGNIIEEKSIASISVVRLTSPTPSMVDQEETERLEELERFLEAGTDREDSDADRDTDNDSLSGGDELISEKDHVTGDDNDNTGCENNDDSTETEAEAPKLKKRPGRKPKPPKKQKKRRKPKERPQIVGLSVEQFYAENSADLVVKNALKLAGLSLYKRTPETDAIMEVIRNDHNYTPFTSPEQMKAQKAAEKLAMERQTAQGRKFIVQTTAKKRFQVVALGQAQSPLRQLQQLPRQQQQSSRQPQQLSKQPTQLTRQQLPKQLQQPQPTASKQQQLMGTGPRSARSIVNVISSAEDFLDDDEEANSSATADEENADTEELSEPSDASRETDNDRDSDIDFKMNNSRNSNKRKRIKKLTRRSHTQSARSQVVQTQKAPVQPAATPPAFPHLKRRKEPTQDASLAPPAIGQIVQFNNTKAPATVIALGRGIQSTSFLKMRPTHKSLPISAAGSSAPEAIRMSASAVLAAKMRRTPIVQVARTGTAPPFVAPPQDIKEIIINKNMSSPKGVFTNLNSLLAENNNTTMLTASPDSSNKQTIQLNSPSTPKSSLNAVSTTAASSSKGFTPIGVETTSKLPAQIVIETHQSSSELAAENDKQLDLIDSIVLDELLKASLVEQPPDAADENTIPKLVQMLESSVACLDKVAKPNVDVVSESQQQNFDAQAAVDSIDEDKITADFLQHVVGLIEEDKQFEAEVVKQVLASTETGGLDAIASVVAPQIFDAANQLPTISQPLTNEFPANVLTSSLANLPIASSTPARTTTTTISLASRPDTKVVRNGRVIYLPPIEAPTTRAKRRAQNFPATASDVSNSSFGEPTLDVSQLISSSLDSDIFSSQVGGLIRKQLPKGESGGSVRRPKRSDKQSMGNDANDPDASESQEDDDDPNKLWCICRQPHNNRFMICCDLCEDWYHGTCVSVTKAMGLEMEQKGIDWKCPKCVKKQEEKSQPRITDMLLPQTITDSVECVTTLPKQPNDTKVTVELQELTPRRQPGVAVTVASLPTTTTNSLTKQQQKRPLITKPQPKMHQQQLHFIKLGSSSSSSVASVSDANVCIVCKRAARINSVYCSDDCIRKYAQNAIQAQTVSKSPEPQQLAAAATQAPLANALDAKKNKKKDLFEDVLRQADSVSKVERINVFERRSGRAITGHLAPSAQQLKKWLQDNPSFEVVQPGSLQALEIEKRQGKRQPELASPEATPVKSPLPFVVQKPPETQRSIQLLPTLPNTVKKEKVVAKTPITQRRTLTKSSTERSGSKSQPEPIRLNIRRTLKEQLLARIKEAQDADLAADQSQWLTASEVENFVKRVESEMYHSFGRDVGAKYKSKYRSLIFNIRDRKNKTLFEKICAKQVEPKQLVRMTPSELASQELAKWREEENRHQLDIIKKSELDLLACAQNYVVKTHKGEEVIEAKLDVTLPEEELEPESNKELLLDSFDSKSASQCTADTSTATDTSSKEIDLERSHGKEKTTKLRDKGHSRERDRDKEKERDKRHKSRKHHYQSGSKRSRSRSSSEGHSQRGHKRHHHDHDADKVEKAEKEPPAREKQLSKERSEKVQSPLQNKPAAEKKVEQPLTFSLVDQILESEKTVEQAANLRQPAKPTLKPLPTKPVAKSEVRAPVSDKYVRYLQSISSPALWTGNLNMVDVTDFDVIIHPVYGNTGQLGKLMPANLDVIGRITRVNVWDYIKKIRKSPTKEIIIVNLFPASVSQTVKFDSFFEYLDTRQRLGVLGADSEEIRDFYIFPLGTHDKLPTVLQTLDSVPFYEDTQRPNTLLGIIVRHLTNRLVNLSQSLPSSVAAASNKTAKMLSKTRVRTTFTPPCSPKRKPSTHSTSSKDDEFDIDAIIKAPIAKLQRTNVSIEPRTSLDDQNAPYSPGGSSDDSDVLSALPPANKDELERKVDEINKQIAAQRMEIAGLLNMEPSSLDKPTSSSNVLAGISIPPNLTKILASLKEQSESNKAASSDNEYNPKNAITLNSSYAMSNQNADGVTKTKSRLAQLSEAELLSMVPDNLVDIPSTPSPSIRHSEPPPPGV